MVKDFQLTVASITMFHLVEVNTTILREDGSIQLAHERDHLPTFLLDMKQRDFLLISRQTKQDPNSCCLYTNDLGFTYISSMVEFQEESSNIWIIGPFLMQIPDTAKMEAVFHSEQSKHSVMLEFIKGLKLLSNSKIQSISNIMRQAGSIRQTPYRIVSYKPESTEQLEKNDIHYMLKQPDEGMTKLIELRYELERELMNAVVNGDHLKMKEMMSGGNHLFDFSERFPNQPVRAMKNMLIVFNTMLRMAAKEGRVHPFFLHHISEKFSKRIERSDSINSLNVLLQTMHNEYCILVRDHAISSGYSSLVRQAAQHIKIHFSQALNLNQLAQLCFVHPAHLSRQFKKETGMTLTDFQNSMRMNEAKHLLKEGRVSIDRIAGYVGFDDAGYFTRLFKRLEGMTPSQYRKAI